MCLFVALGLLVPRVTLALLWFFTEATRGVFNPWWLGLLGFIFVPYTALTYVLIHWFSGTVTMEPVNLILLVIAVIADTGMWHGARKSRR